MAGEAANMILVGVAEQEAVNVQASFFVALQAIAQLRHHIRRVVIWVVGYLYMGGPR